MTYLLPTIFGTDGRMPLGATLGWDSPLLRLHALGDAVLGISYLLIPAAMIVFLRRRRDLPRQATLIATLFIAFIVCGAFTHLLGLLTLWVPAYPLQGLFKIVTAGTALATGILIWPQIPKLLALPSPRDLAKANLALVQANASLETTIAWRTHELERANQRFEQALSRSNITVFAQDRDLRYTWVHNPRLGFTEKEMIGHRADELLLGSATDELIGPKRQALATGQTVNATVSFASGSEGRLYFDMTITPTHDPQGQIDGILCTAVDVTEKRLFEVRLAAMAVQLATTNRRFELALENSAVTIFEQDRDLRYTYVYNPPPGMSAEELLERSDPEMFSPDQLATIVPPKERVLSTGERQTFQIEIEIGGATRHLDVTVDPKLDGSDQIIGIVGSAFDLTEQRHDEQRLRLMMRELTHRSKNLLAVIQAMARKTASLSTDMDSFIADFSSRLRAMAAAHDLLVSESWHGADLAELLRTSLAQTISLTGDQVSLEGPPIMLAPDTAQNLGLAFHELATNAGKYGALATDSGRLKVTWSTGDDGNVRIIWEESGGAEVEPPVHTGFGRVLLERLIGATLNGTVTLDFRKEGLTCEIVFPQKT